MKLELWKQHVAEWKDCTRCDLSQGRKRIVLARGAIPCSVLFLGEAPGKSENSEGVPFHGPAGKLLDKMIASTETSLKIAFTNLVACIPWDDDHDKTREPEAKEITACRDRVDDLVKICEPKLIVCVGKLAAKWLNSMVSHREAKRLDILHPASLLRMAVVQRPVEEERIEVQLRNAFMEIA